MTRRDFTLPGTRPRYAPDRDWAVNHIKIDIELDVADRSIRGTCSLALSPVAAARSWVSLDAVELDIHRVQRDGQPLSFRHDGRLLRVDLGAPVDAGETVVVDVTYGGSPRRGLYFVGPDEGYPDKPVQVWTQGQDVDSRYWFPCFDTPHQKATSEVVVTVPAGFVALSNGDLIEDATAGDRRRMHWRFDVPHSSYLITLAAGELSVLRDRWEDVDVQYYVQPGREDDARRTLGRTPEMLDLFSRRFGVRYPYSKYAQVFVADFIFGGMENTTATTLTDVVLLDDRAALDYDAEALVSHELAHQWFGDLLTCRDWGEGWLNEGFATYAEYIWREHAEGEDAAAVELEEWAQQYFGEDAKRYRRKVATKLYDDPIDIFDHHLYEKGGRVLHMLRRIVGDDGFWRAIRHYLTVHRTGSVETRDLARAVEAATGRVLDWFFEQWITHGAGHPELEVKYAWDPDAQLAQVTVEQTHETDGQTPLFRLPTAVRFRVGDRDVDRAIEITERQQTFFFALDDEPAQVILDPGKHLLAQVKAELPTPLWAAQLAGATCALDRIHAARALGERGGRAATDALIAALETDPFWGARAAAADALGKLRTERARDALIAALDGPAGLSAAHAAKARRHVVRALGELRGDARAGDALADRIVRGDASYFVEAEACLALGKTRTPRAPEVLRAAARRESFLDIIRQHAYRGLAEARDDTAIELLRGGTAYGRPSHGRRAALAALASIAQGRRDREARDIRELCERLLSDRDFRVQSAAVEALAVIADPAAIGALRELIARALDGRLRRRAREVIRDIEAGAARDEQLASLRDQVDSLRANAIKLAERLERVELSVVEARDRKKKGKRKKKSR